MAKRVANKYLTDQNWEEEDEPEEKGVFKVADASVLKQRVIKKARRRGTNTGANSNPSTGAFSGFGGLTKPSDNGSAKPFSFGSTQSKPFSFGAGNKGLPFGSSKPLGFSGTGSLTNAVSSSSTALPKPSNNGDTTVSSTSTTPNFSKVSPIVNDKENSDKYEASSTTSGAEVNKENGSGFSKKDFSGEKLQCNTLSSSSVAKDKKASNVPNKDDDEYGKHLRALNKGVCSWIVEHVDKNPLCDLTPIFQDYKKHLAEIDQKFNSTESEDSSPENSSLESNTPKDSSHQSSQDCSTSAPSSPNASPKPKSSNGSIFAQSSSKISVTTIAEASSNDIKVPAENPLGSMLKSNAPQKAPVFTGFGSGPSSDEKSKFTGFGLSKSDDTSKFSGFGSSKVGEAPKFSGFGGLSSTSAGGFSGFQFQSSMVGGNSTKDTISGSVSSTTDANESEYVPPKPESTTIEEKDAFYSKKCKLFYMLDNAYKNKGVGNLHLKPVPDTNKTQLIIRADNAVGTILLNIVLSPSLPISRQGKNNITIVCIPNPPVRDDLEGKVVPLLIRVKTSEDADELKDLLNNKKES